MIGVQPSRAARAFGKLELALVVVTPFATMLLAAWIYFAGHLLPEGRTHRGHLLDPPISLGRFGSPELTVEQLGGRWAILIVTHCPCGPECRESLQLTKQSCKALDRDSRRVRRYLICALAFDPMVDGVATWIAEHHPDLQILSGAVPGLRPEPEPVNGGQTNDRVRIFVADPRGNVMLWYGQEQQSTQLLKDLQRLLKASQIG